MTPPRLTMWGTLTRAEVAKLMLGDPVGIFKELEKFSPPFNSHLSEMSMDYYTRRSGAKPISPMYEILLENATPTQTPEMSIALVLYNKYGKIWQDVYDEIITTYNPLEEYTEKETVSGTGSDNKTYTDKQTMTGESTDTETRTEKGRATGESTDSNRYIDTTVTTGITSEKQTTSDKQTTTNSETDNITYDINIEDNGNTGRHEERSTTNNSNSGVYGFNSPSSVPSETVDTTGTDTLNADPERNTNHNLNSKTGTENKTVIGNASIDTTNTKNIEGSVSNTDEKSGTNSNEFSKSDTIDKTGNATKETTKSDTVNKNGNEGVDKEYSETRTRTGRKMEATELLQNSIDFHLRNVLWEMVYNHIDSLCTLSIY